MVHRASARSVCAPPPGHAAARVFHDSLRRRQGPNKRGAVKATDDAVNDGSYTDATLRSHFTQDGHRMLDRARRSEAEDNARRSERREG